MGAPWFAPDAETILRQDAQEWKKRALAAESKLFGYRRLREAAEELLRSVCEKDAGAKAEAVDRISEELATLDVIEPPKDPYLQTIELGDGKRLEVRLRANIGSCSTMDVEKGIIEIEALQPDEGKAIGLFFQVLQLADIALALRDGTKPRMDADFLHGFVVPFLALASDLGLLAPCFDRVSATSIGSHLVTIENLTTKEAASGSSE